MTDQFEFILALNRKKGEGSVNFISYVSLFYKISLCLILILYSQITQANENKIESESYTFKNKLSSWWSSQAEPKNKKIYINAFNQFTTNNIQTASLSNIWRVHSEEEQVSKIGQKNINFKGAILEVLQRNPEVAQRIADLAKQEAIIGIAKAQYFPQLSAGIGTADLTSKDRGQQVLSLSATQLLYDFGKVKSAVTVEKAKQLQSQAELLFKIDELSQVVANLIVNIERYWHLVQIAEQQMRGMEQIVEIAQLRAKAGISSQADPVQALSNLQAAKSTKMIHEAQLQQYQQRLAILLGYDISSMKWDIPSILIDRAGLYEETEFNHIPKMMLAQAAVDVVQHQKQQTKLSIYPTVQIKGSLSQALNGRNPNNNQENGFDHAVMLEATSHFYQGGAIRAQNKAASYAEEAAKAQVATVYLDVLEQIRLIRDEIKNKQQLMQVLAERRETTKRTKALYQEQYKLGTRTVIDLLNAEQAIHSVAQEIETARYDIYTALIRYIEITGRSREVYGLNHIAIQGVEIYP